MNGLLGFGDNQRGLRPIHLGLVIIASKKTFEVIIGRRVHFVPIAKTLAFHGLQFFR